ncbi:MAG: DUF3147 family protein [Acidobacteria bacterium]|nr:DUF3147 family protein [Acidobacteriota bacterium]
MIVKFNPSALRRSKWYEVVLRIIFGGLATVGTGLIAKEYGPVVGGLFLAFPAIFPATATLVEKHQKEKKSKAKIDGVNRGRRAVALEARGTVMGSLGLAVFALLLWRLLDGIPTWLALLSATVAWLLTSVVIWESRRLIRGRKRSADPTR